jgi:hypothetical protein
VALYSLGVIPSYVLFALTLMLLSAMMTRLLGWRTLPYLEMRIVDFERPLLNWVRFMVALHLVRFFAGSFFRGSPSGRRTCGSPARSSAAGCTSTASR